MVVSAHVSNNNNNTNNNNNNNNNDDDNYYYNIIEPALRRCTVALCNNRRTL